MTDPSPIIVACASPPGRSPRALIRISGDDLAPLAGAMLEPVPENRSLRPARLRALRSDLFQAEDRGEGEATDRPSNSNESSPSASGRPTRPVTGHPLPHGRGSSSDVDDPSDRVAARETMAALPVLAGFFAAPHSFTGEDVIELQLPGNPALVDRVLRRVLNEAGRLGRSARLAEPGEFTRRAFTAGRIDLTRAEGIAATVAARSEAELQAAGLLRKGQLGQWSQTLVDRLARLLALVEAGIDFVDQDDVVAIAPTDLLAGLAEIESALIGLLDRSRSWSQLEALPWVVLIGPPNAGKSTLFNALLGRPRAVASGIAGTTRDVLTEPLTIEGQQRKAELMLVDIAGLDEPAAALDEAVQQAAREAIARADLLIEVDDGSRDAPVAPLESWAASGTPRLRVRAKADRSADPAADVNVSAATGEGLDALRGALAARLAERAVTIGGRMLALQPRHRQAINAALDAVREARGEVEPWRDATDLPEPEVVAEIMRQALDRLGEVGGRMTPDDVIGRVFATFCVGK